MGYRRLIYLSLLLLTSCGAVYSYNRMVVPRKVELKWGEMWVMSPKEEWVHCLRTRPIGASLVVLSDPPAIMDYADEKSALFRCQSGEGFVHNHPNGMCDLSYIDHNTLNQPLTGRPVGVVVCSRNKYVYRFRGEAPGVLHHGYID